MKSIPLISITVRGFTSLRSMDPLSDLKLILDKNKNPFSLPFVPHR